MLCVYHPKTVTPPKPKLLPGTLFFTATGKYMVTKDRSMKLHWTGIHNVQGGFLCVRLDAGPRTSKFDTWEWENRGSYTVIPNGQCFELQQHLPT